MRIDRDSCAPGRSAFALALALALAFAFVVNSAFAQEVTLPLGEYEALRERAAPRDVVAPTLAAPIVLESAIVEVLVGRDNARVTTNLTLAIYQDGWQELELPPGGNLTSVELGGLEGRLSASASSEPEGERVLSCRGPGRYTLRLVSVVPVVPDRSAARPTRSLDLTFPWAGTVTGTIGSDVDTDEIELLVGALADGASGPGGTGFIGEPGGAFRARLLGETDGTVERDRDRDLSLLFEASSFAMTHVRRSRIDVIGFLELDVVQGRMRQVELPVPSDMDVLAVESPTGAELGWDLDADGGLVVRFAEPVIGVVPLRLSFARSFAAGESLERFLAPLIAARNASRMLLVSGLSADEDGIPILLRASSGRRATEEDLEFLPESEAPKSASLFVVRDPVSPPEWRVEWAELDPTTVLASQVDRLVVDALVGEAGRVAYQYWAVVRSPGASTLTFTPPPEFELIAADRSGRPITAARTAEGLVVPLAAGSEAQVLRISGIVRATELPERGELVIPIPALSAPVARVEVRAVVPGERRYEIESEGFETRIGAAPTGTWFSIPSSHRVVTASWAALDTRPSPLEIRVRSEREKRRWY